MADRLPKRARRVRRAAESVVRRARRGDRQLRELLWRHVLAVWTRHGEVIGARFQAHQRRDQGFWALSEADDVADGYTAGRHLAQG